MTSAPPSDDPEDHSKPQADGRERLRPSLGSFKISDIVGDFKAPNFLGDFKLPNFLRDFKGSDIVDVSALAKVAADAANFASFSISESVAKQLMGLSGFAAQQSKVFESFKHQSAWDARLIPINSDFFKTHAATQAQFATLGSELAKTLDLGISDTLARAVQQFAAQRTSWLETLEPTHDWLRKGFYPPNLRAIGELEFQDVEKVVMVDGIALYGVPRASIAKALISADSASKRRKILGTRRNAISADCREVLEMLRSEAVAPYVPFAVAALDALDSDHTQAAQALTGSLIDSLLTRYFGDDRRKYTPDKRGKRTTDAYDELPIREFIALAPMWQAYQQFWVKDGDLVPRTFNRHATAHAVSERQFSQRNTVQALLFATGLLSFFAEEESMHRSRDDAAR